MRAPELGERIDDDRIGVAGFSAGGYTSLLLGATPSQSCHVLSTKCVLGHSTLPLAVASQAGRSLETALLALLLLAACKSVSMRACPHRPKSHRLDMPTHKGTEWQTLHQL